MPSFVVGIFTRCFFRQRLGPNEFTAKAAAATACIPARSRFEGRHRFHAGEGAFFIDKVQQDEFVLPGLKGEIKLDRCYRGREHFVCRYDALLTEGKSLIEEFTRIVDEHYRT